ncbi:MAG: hypothetical protein HOH13_06980 [Crocinitomicaceae bacterium]|nr:hypothetical protein [Crocinitomicaceae bacterium]
MRNLIRNYYDLPGDFQIEMMNLLKEGELERTTFPKSGEIVDGVIFLKDDNKFLVPMQSIARIKPEPSLDALETHSFEGEE